MSVDRDVFIREQLRPLLRTAYLLTGNQQDAEDLTQEVLVKVHRHWRKVQGSDDPGRYVHRVLANQFLDDRRRKRVPTQSLDSLGPGAVSGTDDGTKQVDDRAQLAQALNELAPRERLAVVLRFYGQMPVADVAVHMQVTDSTVRATLSRAIQHLRADLSPGDEHAAGISSPTKKATP